MYLTSEGIMTYFCWKALPPAGWEGPGLGALESLLHRPPRREGPWGTFSVGAAWEGVGRSCCSSPCGSQPCCRGPVLPGGPQCWNAGSSHAFPSTSWHNSAYFLQNYQNTPAETLLSPFVQMSHWHFPPWSLPSLSASLWPLLSLSAASRHGAAGSNPLALDPASCRHFAGKCRGFCWSWCLPRGGFSLLYLILRSLVYFLVYMAK